MGPAVVVVDVPDAKGFAALVFGGPHAGVEEFRGQDPVVALESRCVRRVGRDPLVVRPEQRACECVGAVARSVVRDDAIDVGDAMLRKRARAW